MQVHGEHSATLSTLIKLPFVIKIFVLSILSDPFTQVLLYFIIIYHLGPYYFMIANTMNTDQTVVEDSEGVCSNPPPPPPF